MADWDTVRELAGAFPGAEESTTYGKPCFKVKGKLFAWLSPDDAAEGALAVRVDPGCARRDPGDDPGDGDGR